MLENDETISAYKGFVNSLSPQKRSLLFVLFPVSLLVYVVGATFLDHYHPGAAKALDVVFTIAANVMAFAWCKADSTERGYELHRAFSFAVVIFGTFALIYYLFRSRGFRDGLAAVGWLTAYVVCTTAAVFFVSLVIFFVLFLTGVASPEVFSNTSDRRY